MRTKRKSLRQNVPENNVKTTTDVGDPLLADIIKNITKVNAILSDLMKDYQRLKTLYTKEESVASNKAKVIYKVQLKEKEKVPLKPVNFDPDIIYKVHLKAKKKAKVSLKPVNYKLFRRQFIDTANFSSEMSDADNEIETKDALEPFQSRKTTKKNKKKVRTKITIKEVDHMKKKKSRGPKTNLIKTKIKLSTKNKIKDLTTTSSEDWSSTEYSSVSLTEEIEKPKNLSILTELLSPDQIVQDISSEPVKFKTKDRKIKKNSNKTLAISDVDDDEMDSIFNSATENTGKLSSEVETRIQKEMIRANVLRKAFGESCLKVMIHKCYKACKNTLKDSCARFKCKSVFTNDFKTNSKSGCVGEFKKFGSNLGGDAETPGMETQVVETPVAENLLAVDNADTPPIVNRANDEFNDMGRNYLAAVCLPLMRSDPKRRALDTGDSGAQEQIVYRSKYETDCKKETSQKCRNACKYAAVETCSIHLCQDKQKKDLIKTCKKECKRSSACGSDRSSSGSGSSGSGSGCSD